MATCVHASPCRPSLPVLNKSQSHQCPHNQCVLPVRVKSLKLTTNASTYCLNGLVLKHGQHEHSMKYQQGTPVCLLGNTSLKNEGSGWNPFEQVMGNFNGKSIEDVLRQQIEKQEFYDGGSGKNPPRGGSGSGNGSGGSEDESIAGIIDETLQVVFSYYWLYLSGDIYFLGKSFCAWVIDPAVLESNYIYIISGEELTRLSKDYIKYLLRGSKSVRLKRAMYKWKRFYQKLIEKKVVDKMWLERAIISTPTAYYSPAKYRQMFKSFLASNVNE